MAAARTRKRRQRRRVCRYCGELFWAHPRVGGRQHVCGKPECQRRRQRDADRKWHEQHPDYDVERRLRVLRERLERSEDPCEVVRGEAEPMCRLPADVVQEEFGVQGLAILVVLGRLTSRSRKMR